MNVLSIAHLTLILQPSPLFNSFISNHSRIKSFTDADKVAIKHAFGRSLESVNRDNFNAN